MAAANICFALFAIGVGTVFLASDWRLNANRALAVAFWAIGAGALINLAFLTADSVADLPWWTYFSGPSVSVIAIGSCEWVRHVRRTIVDQTFWVSVGNVWLRTAQFAAVVYAILSMLFYEQRSGILLAITQGRPPFTDSSLLVFPALLAYSFVSLFLILLLTLRREPDAAEKVRMLAYVIGAPFLATALVVGPTQSAIPVSIGLIAFMLGASQYHVLQGQRGAFMSRFLAPQLSNLIRQTGLKRAMEDKLIEMSVVFCDLRGFTHWSSNNEPGRVLDLLREYYDLVGEAAVEEQATIKDYAGDGVMLLVGAPITREDHAVAALALAKKIRDRVGQRMQEEHGAELAVGVGVASGRMQVGVVGNQRLEYVAVGEPANLASRLCDKAKAGQVLLSAATMAAIGNLSREQFTKGAGLDLKGFDEPVQAWLADEEAPVRS